MSLWDDDNPIWEDKINRLLDELCELLSDYEYGSADRIDIIKKETHIYELTEEYVPQLLDDLDEFQPLNFQHLPS